MFFTIKSYLLKEETTTSRGISLVEMMVGTTVLLLVGSSIVSSMFQGQKTFISQNDLMEASQDARIAMSQIKTFFRQAGNDPYAIGLVPVTIDSANQTTIRSDVTGVLGTGLTATGEPDGTLNNLYEQVVVRYDPAADQLFVNVGNGEELLARNISAFNLAFNDLQGAATTDGNQVARVHIELVLQTKSADMQTGNVNSVTLESDVMVRSKAYELFAFEANPGHVTP